MWLPKMEIEQLFFNVLGGRPGTPSHSTKSANLCKAGSCISSKPFLPAISGPTVVLRCPQSEQVRRGIYERLALWTCLHLIPVESSSCPSLVLTFDTSLMQSNRTALFMFPSSLPWLILFPLIQNANHTLPHMSLPP